MLTIFHEHSACWSYFSTLTGFCIWISWQIWYSTATYFNARSNLILLDRSTFTAQTLLCFVRWSQFSSDVRYCLAVFVLQLMCSIALLCSSVTVMLGVRIIASLHSSVRVIQMVYSIALQKKWDHDCRCCVVMRKVENLGLIFVPSFLLIYCFKWLCLCCIVSLCAVWPNSWCGEF